MNSGLPEDYDYRDEGCDVNPLCLTCPLEMCKFDDPNWYVKQVHAEYNERRAVALRLREQGLPADAIAARLGVTRRSVFRWLAA